MSNWVDLGTGPSAGVWIPNKEPVQPLAWLKMDEPSGTIHYDISGNGAHANIYDVGGVHYMRGIAGPAQGSAAVQYDGVKSHATMEYNPALFDSVAYQWTIMAWVRTWQSRPGPSDQGCGIISKAFNGSFIPFVMGYGNVANCPGSRVFAGWYTPGNGWIQAYDANEFPLNTWCHYAGSLAPGGRVGIYKNGVDVGSNTVDGQSPPATTYPVYLGHRWDTANTYPGFPGWIWDVRIYNVALAEWQIAEIANRTGPAPPAKTWLLL